MLLEVTHETNLKYADHISESVIELRMCPMQLQYQHRLSFDLAVGPAAQVGSYFDWLDNLVHTFTVNPFHQQIRIVATSVVETERLAPPLETLTDPWPLDQTYFDHSMIDYLAFDGPVVDHPMLRELVAKIAPQQGELVGEICRRVLDIIRDDFKYEQGVTTAASPITDVLEHRSGVCQDFTHLAIALFRAMGIPARYVSGLVHTSPNPDQPHFRGAAETHAWADVYLPDLGWVGMDATNHCTVGEHFVSVAVGRHFGDVPPNKGVYRGSADETIDVQVSTRELTNVPPELAAEHFSALDIATSPGRHGGFVGQNERQEQQQQQQQQ